MGGCCGKSASQIEAEEKEQQKQQKDAAIKRARSLGITAQFLGHWATLEEADLDALLAEIKRREEMPPMTITCLLPEEASQEERQITVRGYEAVGFSVNRELGVSGVEKVSFANVPVEDLETTRWEELDIETDAVVSAFGLQYVTDALVAAMAAANPHVEALKFEQRITRDPDVPWVLKRVNFSGLEITALPEMIGGLKITGSLDLSGNKLTSLPESMGSIQVGGNLTLSNNQLTALPESMGSIQVGGGLHLECNKLTSLPESMGSMKVGGGLYLGHNQLTSLPESMGSIKVYR